MTTKSALPTPTTRPAKTATTKALIMRSALSLGISKVMAKRLGQKSEELDPEAQSAMLHLMEQDDPYNTVKTFLVEKFGATFAVYKEPDMGVFAPWVKHADKHLHGVDALVHELDDHETASVTTTYSLAGLHRHDDQHYNSKQLRNIALVTAAASVTGITHPDTGPKNYIITTEWSATNAHNYLNNQIITDRIAASPDTTREVLRLIIEEHLITNAEIIHRLDGTPLPLATGTL